MREMCEADEKMVYYLNGSTGIDMQRVQTTGYA